MNLAWFDGLGPSKRLVVSYDSLLNDTETELRRVLDWLGVSASEKAMSCVMSHKEGYFRRAKKQLSFNLFDDGMRDLLSRQRVKLYNRVGIRLSEKDRETAVKVAKETAEAKRMLEAGMYRIPTSSTPAPKTTPKPKL